MKSDFIPKPLSMKHLKTIYKTIKLTACIATAMLFSMPMSAENPYGKFTVVLDAGHGGHDVGASENGVHEKDINLGVAKKLEALISKKYKDFNVVMTRSDDKFISLQDRANIANRNHGNLFISIHTNSVDKSNPNRKNVSGASVYALGLHKDQSNLQVAQRENSVIELENNFEQKYSGFDPNKDESYIIFEMAQKKNLGQSLKFASEAQKQLVSIAGRADRGVKQAGFWVLWATSMPAVLVELDFICNPNVAEYLGSEKGQDQLAQALFKAFENYTTSIGATSSASVKSHSTHAATASNSSKKQKSAQKGTKAKAEQQEAVPETAPKSADDIDQTPVLVSTDKLNRNDVAPSYATKQTTTHRQTTSNRKRRSASSRRTSEARDLETPEILLASEDVYLAKVDKKPTLAKSNEEPSENKPTNNKGKKGKNTKSEKRNNGKVHSSSSKQQGNYKTITVSSTGETTTREYRNNGTVAISSTPKEHKSVSNYKPKVSHLRTIYMIQILASGEELKPNSPRFGGLKPISSFRENGLYKYTYGQSEDRSEMERLLAKVKDIIPDAFIISSKR